MNVRRRPRAEFPHLECRLIVTGEPTWPNANVGLVGQVPDSPMAATITWRGRRYRVEAQGRFAPVESTT